MAGLQKYLPLLSFVKFIVGVPSLGGPGAQTNGSGRVEMSQKLSPEAPRSRSTRKLQGLPVGLSVYLTGLF